MLICHRIVIRTRRGVERGLRRDNISLCRVERRICLVDLLLKAGVPLIDLVATRIGIVQGLLGLVVLGLRVLLTIDHVVIPVLGVFEILLGSLERAYRGIVLGSRIVKLVLRLFTLSARRLPEFLSSFVILLSKTGRRLKTVNGIARKTGESLEALHLERRFGVLGFSSFELGSLLHDHAVGFLDLVALLGPFALDILKMLLGSVIGCCRLVIGSLGRLEIRRSLLLRRLGGLKIGRGIAGRIALGLVIRLRFVELGLGVIEIFLASGKRHGAALALLIAAGEHQVVIGLRHRSSREHRGKCESGRYHRGNRRLEVILLGRGHNAPFSPLRRRR